MQDYTLWWLITGLIVALELMTGSFFLLMIAIGMAAGATAAHFGASLVQQLLSAALVGAAATAMWYQWRRLRPSTLKAAYNPDVNLDVGQQVQVDVWEPSGHATVKYRGADWKAVLHNPNGDQVAAPGRYRIVAVYGSQLQLQSVSTPTATV